jgi:hypothetical protein
MLRWRKGCLAWMSVSPKVSSQPLHHLFEAARRRLLLLRTESAYPAHVPEDCLRAFPGEIPA